MNKKLVFLYTFILLGAKINCQNCVFDNESHNFGNISIKEKFVTHQFKFKNISEDPLIIKSANTRCSCIESAFSKHPVAGGDTGSVYIRYHINGTGIFNKRIKIITNSGNSYLNIKGNCYKEKTN